MQTTNLAPYLPRLVIDWLHQEPSRRLRTIDGSMVFVDISGFTNMSERLARHGKVGAEEVTDVINSTFTRLLAVAYEDGGSLLKFGGDALLLFYTGQNHAARACRAAAGMRQKLREIGPIPTSAGLVRLRMSVGVHSGEFHLFLAGDAHRELIVTGPAASAVVAMESTAQAGEILVTAATATHLDPRLLGEGREGGLLLKKVPPATRVPLQIHEVADGLDLSPLIPVLLRDRVGTAGSDGEHRQATIGFVHFGGLDAKLAEDGEQVADLLDALVGAIQRECDRYGLTFLYTDIAGDGGKAILLAGAPFAADDDEERMLRALHGLLERDHGLPVRAGVHRGHVFVGEIGPPYRRTYTVIGDAVNLAARVMSKADHGTLLATASVLAKCGDRFEVEPLEPFMVKGKSQPVSAARICSFRAHENVRERDDDIFIGRARETETLRRALSEAGAGNGLLIEVTGEAGIGKSRLLASAIGEGNARVIEIRCDPYRSTIPYFATRSLLRRLLGIDGADDQSKAGAALLDRVANDAPALLPWLPLIALAADARVAPTPETDALHPDVRAPRARKAILDLLDALLGERSVIVFDDAHAMDQASRELIRELAGERLSTRPWAVVVSGRSSAIAAPETQPPATRTIALGPLTRDEAISLAARLDNRLLPAELALLAARSGGNPLFLRELVDAAEPGNVESLPDSVEQIVASKLDRLAPHDLAVLRHAAVVGSSFDPALVHETVAATGEAVPDQTAWSRLGEFIELDGERAMRFRQQLFRDVAYEALPFRRRRVLHERIGERLEAKHPERDPETAALLSLHFHHAQRYEKAWSYALLAGYDARERYALAEAATLLRRAIEASRHLPGVDPELVAGVRQSLGDVMQKSGRYDEAVEAFREARRIAPPEAQPELLLKEAAMRERWGQYAQALRWIGRGLRAAEALVDQTARVEATAKLLLAAAAVRLRQGKVTECIAHALEVVSLAEQIGDRERLANAFFILDSAYTDIGDVEQAARYRGPGLALFEELGDLQGQARMLGNLGVDAYYEGRWNEASSYYRRSLEAYEKTGIVVDAASAANNTAEILSDQGRTDEAIPLFEQALAVWHAAGFRIGVALATANLGRAATRAGRLDEGGRLLEQALASFTEIGAGPYVLRTQAWIVEHLVLAGSHARALELAEEAFERVKQVSGMPDLITMMHRMRGYAALQAGHIVLAQDSFDESLLQASAADLKYETALAYEALARECEITGRNADERPSARAAELFDQLGVVRTPHVPLPGAELRWIGEPVDAEVLR